MNDKFPKVIPPSPEPNRESEKAVLMAAILFNAERANILNELHANYFSDTDLATVASCIIALYSREGALDIILLTSELKKREVPNVSSLIVELTVNCDADHHNWRTHLKIIREIHERRKEHARLLSSLEAISNGEAVSLPDNANQSAKTKAKGRRTRNDDSWKPFPTDQLPATMKNYIREVANSIQCDEAFVALPLLVVCASAIGATRRLRLSSTWTVPSIIWACLLAESGRKKSPPMEWVKKLLGDVQTVALREYSERQQQYERDKKLYDADFAEWKRKGRTSGDPPTEEPPIPVAARYLVDNITLESLAPILQDNPRGVACMVDELGAWFGSFNEYKGSGSDANRWLELFNGGSTIIDRKTGPQRMIVISNAAISICGGTQPEPLRTMLGREGFKNGMAARILTVQPPARIPKWQKNEVEIRFDLPMRWRIAELLNLEFDTGANGENVPKLLKLSPEAEGHWEQFFNEHNEQQVELIGDLGAAWAKLEQYAARIALVLQLVSNPESVEISGEIMKSACILVGWFKHEVRRVYGDLSLSNDERDKVRTIQLIERRGGRIRERELQRADRRFKTSEDAELELQSLVDAGFGSWESVPAGTQGGKPTREFVLFDRSQPDSVDCRHYPENTEPLVGMVDSRQSNDLEIAPVTTGTIPEPLSSWEEIDQGSPIIPSHTPQL